jgi:hypothetical protein
MKLMRGWKLFLVVSFLLGLFLRTLYVNDMEYKEDEEFNYTQSQLIGTTAPWPAYGMSSGIYIVNPGMSIWVFAGLAKLTGAHTPTELARAVQLFAVFGISLLLVFAFKFVEPIDREPWLWAFSLAMVNPIAILYQRKLWPEPFLPVFSMLMLMGWWKREKKAGAFIWGLVGALVGQVHMSGFFFAAGFFLWTLLFSTPEKRRRVQWKYWFLGSVLGALPLVPWLYYLVTHPSPTALEGGWGETLQLKYWVFWISGAFGLHLGNSLGLLIGDTQIEQLSDFARYPLIAGRATYLVGLAHVGLVCSVGWTVINLTRHFETTVGLSPKRWADKFIGRESQEAFAQNAGFLGAGVLMELTNVNIRRYYMSVVFPFEFLWLSRAALRNNTRQASPPGRRWLALIWVCQLVISIAFIHYVHVNQGSTKGDYGDAYHVTLSKRASSAHP